ncbi:PucR family transcriptional regulator ligand-binding domain-containing protein [Arthrobacter alpinus]|uniref:PucR family transcriptional regulator ligand-binding domain-containing protein n=1 Tax=Arthrobacter alpinus TaxID=656366 RepID=UPI00164872E4|nr:PucR family transcriptional regulator ligand-binding domain-containing protein [Arthrobacter alpinus]
MRPILELPAVPNAHPEVLGEDGALDAPVRRVHVSELPDLGGLLSGGELLVTTGHELDKDPGRTAAYIHSLETAALQDATTAAEMPIAIVHSRVRFGEVTEIVHKTIVGEQRER